MSNLYKKLTAKLWMIKQYAQAWTGFGFVEKDWEKQSINKFKTLTN